MRGSFLGLEFEDSAVRGRNRRSQVLFCWLMVMSLVRTERVGSEEGGVHGTASFRRVKVPDRKSVV